jgi:pimeloyl-ACP methyl ester carboxylesterase
MMFYKILRNWGVFLLGGIVFISVFCLAKYSYSGWDPDFHIATIRSSQDGVAQKIYYYRSTAKVARPLVISLHSWAGNYKQTDQALALLVKQRNWNYIHPDFRGPNNKPISCCSENVISDIDDAILWARNNLRVEQGRIYVIGGSGGGYVALCVWMRSHQKIQAFSIWNPITDLTSWYAESVERKNQYKGDIYRCTGSSNNCLDIAKTKTRSPLFWDVPVKKTEESRVQIFAGLYDGTGKNPVPLTHALKMYNKILLDLKAKDPEVFISDQEMKTLAQSKPTAVSIVNERLGDRTIYLHKKFKNVELIVFDGGHELLADQALDKL